MKYDLKSLRVDNATIEETDDIPEDVGNLTSNAPVFMKGSQGSPQDPDSRRQVLSILLVTSFFSQVTKYLDFPTKYNIIDYITHFRYFVSHLLMVWEVILGMNQSK